MKHISCIIFDLDGTLTHTNELIFATVNHVAEKYIHKRFQPAEITAMFGPPEEVVIERLVGPERLEQAMAEFYSFYETNHPHMADAYGGIRELIGNLKGAGMLLAVFTGKGKRTALITLEKIGIKNYFDLVVTGNDVKNHKPSAEGIRKVMNTFGLKADEVLMVGDSLSDVKAAREAGVRIAGVVWDPYAKDRIAATEVDFLFQSVQDFAGWLYAVLPAPGERVG